MSGGGPPVLNSIDQAPDLRGFLMQLSASVGGTLQDRVGHNNRAFATAVRLTSDQLGQAGASRPSFVDVLFPSGPPAGDVDTKQALDLYKIMVESSEGLVSRRQSVNTFFLTMNGALLTASGC